MRRSDHQNEPPALAISSVSKRYGNVTALESVSFTLAAGECMAVVGESGSGKTTLLRMFNRLVEPDTGSVEVQ
ncbi:MAG TPA: ATP-binding cassette domain-containing protein, partial [Longimicrobiales bacterium]|nr:ATP-binding cassette domain-containing protein [Longimicrobiales bacterium]